MKKINFENLPSTNTPLNAENLNLIQSNMEEAGVVVSATEPTTEEKVWIKKSKNLFDKNDLSVGYYLDYTDGTPVWDSNMAHMKSYIPVKPNTQYTMSANASTIFIIHEYDENKNFIQWTNQNDEKTSYTITTTETTKYVRLSIGYAMKDVIQFELGAEATEYEAFNKKAIYVKEDGTYEEYIKPQVKVSATEPTNEDVWFKKGKNLFDTKQLSMVANCVANSDGTFTSNIQGAYYCYVILTYLNDFILKNKGKTLTLSMNLPNENYIGIIIYGTRTSGTNYQELLAKADHCSLKIADDFTSITRLEIRFNRQNSVFIDTTTVVSEIQLELSDTPTSYEPYIDKEIHVKNANGVFEEFYAEEVVLFNGDTNGTVNLSDSVANYEYIEIFFRDSDNVYDSIKVHEPNGKKISLSVVDHYVAITYIKGKIMNISGNTITNRDTNYNETKISGDGTVAVTNSNYVYVTRVVGYKR